MNRKPVTNVSQVTRELEGAPPGSTVFLVVWRIGPAGGQETFLTLERDRQSTVDSRQSSQSFVVRSQSRWRVNRQRLCFLHGRLAAGINVGIIRRAGIGRAPQSDADHDDRARDQAAIRIGGRSPRGDPRVRGDAAARAAAAGGLAPRQRRRGTAAAALRVARADRERQEPTDVQRPGSARRHESARGAGNGRRRRRNPAARARRSSDSTSGSATRSTARSSRTKT